ncbi:proto-oncogene tyrosine-protein kinase receptor Ret isoform X1 [Hylaeus volcanicus]|uniref:proto-oncogene tyrosine-protein kinase receptor Ret isoform X1 n=1 Tax=Hylaeus volcanicus TaxID=313075 RepID=UPI0023B8029D|nr:proto-oncogene tyrosine-protein kinase receptor Ret isoform X1 [Hylaeus volcanicus]
MMMLLLLLSLLPPRVPASELYFPQSDLSLRLPLLTRNDDRSSWNVKLLELRTLRNDSSEPKNVSYRVTVPREEIATIDPETNSLLFQGSPKEGESEYDTVVVVAKENGARNEAVLEIKVQPIRVDGKQINCTNHVQDMCFWNSSRYKIYENQPVTMIGSFGPAAYAEICPTFRITDYKLLNGTEFFHVVNHTLFANASLDRDAWGPPGGPGPRVSVQVQCIVWEEITGAQHAPIKVLDVDILDQDDNAPVVQGNNSDIVLTLPKFTAAEQFVNKIDLIVRDADTMSSNRYVIRILGDTHDALTVTYEPMSIAKSTEVPYTAIVPRFSVKTTLLPKSPYRVTLRVEDASLLPGYGENTLNVTLTVYGPDHQISTTTTVSSVSSRQQLSYPSSVKVARLASRYSRVAKPSGELHPSVNFSIHGSNAFGVTQKGGIVYVTDENLLRTQPANLTLRIKWSGKDRAVVSSKIRIGLTNASASKVDACNHTKSGRLHSCANAETPEDCESSCGVASGLFSKGNFNGRCMWRWNNRSEFATMSDHYPTCSPDLTHCPDNHCDQLEQLDPRICPQDCTELDVHWANMNKDGRGIESGVGTCKCDDMLQCTCNVDGFSARNDNHGKGNKNGTDGKLRDRENEVLVPDARKASSGPCGPFCMVGLIGGSFFLLIVIVGSFVTSRYRMAAKGTRRDSKRKAANGDANGVAILPSDYIDRGDGLLIGLDTFTAANRHFFIPKSCPPDPKWEFPRSRLTIEQVLGEGEFGRVLRAKAIDIGGTSGPTTVAVKTLKENACASELADLLSEYQLLKEAQHPNVIRLLGACTSPGAPVYLIIEFAEFGSLRNYLRRSRHLESEGRTGGCSSLSNLGEESRNMDFTSAYTVTPRDILSFAWQISKGMAYLADIKLVHRDLAARNVLLAAGKVCKISDFGLTRDVYEDDAYLKRSKGRVPVKWMAPESLADHVYTSKSDVWSFGVLLWELVTLGASPYPGVDVHNLYNLLKAGYRMERPANCSQHLYKLMVSCWHQEPGMRPSFKELTTHWEKMLEDSVEYLDLNPRTVHNQAYFASLHALDSPSIPKHFYVTGSGNDETDNVNVDTFRNDVVNYLKKPSSDTVTKCDNVDKLHTLWQEPIASFPDDSVKLSYVNDLSPSMRANHYESPIKFRNASVTSDSENDLVTPTNERPQSYIDMEGKKSFESEDLLVFANVNGDDDRGEGN